MRALLILVIAGCVEHGQSPEATLPPDPFDPVDNPLPTPPRPPSALELFSGCLTFDDFQTSGVGPVWRGIAVAGCTSCHSDAGFEPDDLAMFQSITRKRTILDRYFEVTEDTLVSDELLSVVAQPEGQYTAHPGFAVEEGRAALDTWGMLATDRFRAGTCAPPTL